MALGWKLLLTFLGFYFAVHLIGVIRAWGKRFWARIKPQDRHRYPWER